jgi:hypothetical protein
MSWAKDCPATASLRAEDDDASRTARLTIDDDVWGLPREPTISQVATPATRRVEDSSLTGKGACPKVATGTASPTESAFVGQGNAVLNEGTQPKIRVHLGSTVTTNGQETTPPDEWAYAGSLLPILRVLNLSVPLAGTGSATGLTVPGPTYDTTATVTPLSRSSLRMPWGISSSSGSSGAGTFRTPGTSEVLVTVSRVRRRRVPRGRFSECLPNAVRKATLGNGKIRRGEVRIRPRWCSICTASPCCLPRRQGLALCPVRVPLWGDSGESHQSV